MQQPRPRRDTQCSCSQAPFHSPEGPIILGLLLGTSLPLPLSIPEIPERDGPDPSRHAGHARGISCGVG